MKNIIIWLLVTVLMGGCATAPQKNKFTTKPDIITESPKQPSEEIQAYKYWQATGIMTDKLKEKPSKEVEEYINWENGTGFQTSNSAFNVGLALMSCGAFFLTSVICVTIDPNNYSDLFQLNESPGLKVSVSITSIVAIVIGVKICIDASKNEKKFLEEYKKIGKARGWVD